MPEYDWTVYWRDQEARPVFYHGTASTLLARIRRYGLNPRHSPYTKFDFDGLERVLRANLDEALLKDNWEFFEKLNEARTHYYGEKERTYPLDEKGRLRRWVMVESKDFATQFAYEAPEVGRVLFRFYSKAMKLLSRSDKRPDKKKLGLVQHRTRQLYHIAKEVSESESGEQEEKEPYPVLLTIRPDLRMLSPEITREEFQRRLKSIRGFREAGALNGLSLSEAIKYRLFNIENGYLRSNKPIPWEDISYEFTPRPEDHVFIRSNRFDVNVLLRKR